MLKIAVVRFMTRGRETGISRWTIIPSSFIFTCAATAVAVESKCHRIDKRPTQYIKGIQRGRKRDCTAVIPLENLEP